MGPKSAASAHQIHLLIQIANGLGWQLTVVVFEGESVTPTCLLGELHSRMALLRYMLHTSDEAKIGIRNRVYCYPICVYITKDCITLLDHIIVGHYWASFSCRRCLAFTTHTTAGMKEHLVSWGKSEMEHSQVRSHAEKLLQVPNPVHRSKGKKSKEISRGVQHH